MHSAGPDGKQICAAGKGKRSLGEVDGHSEIPWKLEGAVGNN